MVESNWVVLVLRMNPNFFCQAVLCWEQAIFCCDQFFVTVAFKKIYVFESAFFRRKPFFIVAVAKTVFCRSSKSRFLSQSISCLSSQFISVLYCLQKLYSSLFDFTKKFKTFCFHKKKMDSTPHCSRVVPHPSTERSQTALMRTGGLRLIWSNPLDCAKNAFTKKKLKNGFNTTLFPGGPPPQY